MDLTSLRNNMKKEETLDDVKVRDFVYIFETYYKRIYNYIYYRVCCHHSSEDLTSKVFEKIMLKINSYSEEKSSFEVWMFAIARNTINDHFRDVKKRKIVSIDGILELESNKKTPEESIITSETNEEILKALRVLDERDRQIVDLKFGGELKNKEIAEILGITESNVGVIIYRSMKRLKREIEREEK